MLAKSRSIKTFAWLGPLGGLLMLAPSLTASAAEPKAEHYRGPAVSVTVAKKKCFTDTIDVTGMLVPKQEVLLRPAQQGYRISHVLVEVGDTVIAGQVLARLAPPEGMPGGNVAVESPSAGVVGKVSAVVGTLTSFQAPPMFQIIAKGEIELEAEVPTKIISRLSPGQPASVKVIGVGLVPGRVRHCIHGRRGDQLGSARIFIGDDRRLRIGAFGRASIHRRRKLRHGGAAVGRALRHDRPDRRGRQRRPRGDAQGASRPVV